MSRSYKRAVVKDTGKYTKIDKRRASKAVRRAEIVADGGYYKKLFCSYDIADFVADLRFYRKNPSDLMGFKQARKSGKGWLIPK